MFFVGWITFKFIFQKLRSERRNSHEKLHVEGNIQIGASTFKFLTNIEFNEQNISALEEILTCLPTLIARQTV